MDNNTNTSRRMQLCICDRGAAGEVTLEYAMPDYRPEIRRLLRVSATMTPPSTYADAGTADLEGRVRFDILYAAPDGGLYSDTVSENYEIALPLDKNTEVDFAEGVSILPEVTPEMAVCRVLAPRKVSIRLRYGAKVRAYGTYTAREDLRGETGTLVRLAGEAETALFCRSTPHRFTLAEPVSLDGAPSGTRVIATEVEMCGIETEISRGAAHCAGTAVLKMLLCNDEENGTPYALTKKIPFAETVSGEDFDMGMSGFARAAATEIRTEVEDGSVLCDIEGVLEVCGQKATATAYTRDIFSTDRTGHETYRTVEYPTAYGCASGNFTQSLYEPIEGFGIAPDATLVDVAVRPTVETVSAERGKWVVTGHSTASLLLKNGDEYAASDLAMPFRFELDGGKEPLGAAASDIRVLSCRGRMDGGRLGIDCEMSVTLRLCGIGSATMLSAAEFGEPCEHYRECVVCFPPAGESLWDVAKKYHVSPETLKTLNKGVGETVTGTYLIVNA